jgi:hypothetical protein
VTLQETRARTAGTPGAHTAVTPTVEQHINGDQLYVTLDLTGQPDLLVMLARALRRTGTMHAFAGLGTSESRLGGQLAAIQAEPTVRDALTLTLDETQTVTLAAALDDATVADVCERCRSRYAVADGLCTVCQPQVIEPGDDL